MLISQKKREKKDSLTSVCQNPLDAVSAPVRVLFLLALFLVILILIVTFCAIFTPHDAAY